MPASPLPRPPITVSIVSHGQLGLILPLLEQLSRHCAHVIARVVLTLNIPEPDLLAGRTWRIPLTRIDNARAQGFGANHNAAFAKDAALGASDWFL
ncbi:MAG: glycosyl transferase, partial [Comamonadaceae bacterium]